MRRVLITPATLADRQGAYLQTLRDGGFDIVFPKIKGQLLETDLVKELEGVSAVIAGSEPYTPNVFAAHPQLRVVARAGVGYDAVDVEAAPQHRVAVCITPGMNQDAVAEHTFALILACAKNVVQQDKGVRAGTWPRGATIPLRGRTLGIAGLGRIGKAVAIRGAAFGMKMLAYEPFQDHDFAKQWNVSFVSLEQLFAEADFLSIHVPLNIESKYLVNKKRLALMKPTAWIINTARGGLVCEADLIPALQNKQIAGAGLDVFEMEPPPPSPLLELDNVVLTPHAAGVDLQSREDMAQSSAQSIVALSQGHWPAEQIVNGTIRESFVW